MKNIIKILAILLIIGVFLVIVSCNTASKYHKFTFSQETIKYIFSEEVESAESFCTTRGLNTAIYKKYVYARSNNNGSLTVIVDDETLREWKSSNWSLQVLQSLLEETNIDIGIDIDWSDDFLDAKQAIKNSGIEVSKDFTVITQGPGDDGSFYPYLVSACIRMQIFNGKQVEDITVTYIEIDSNGNVIDEIIWPSNN